MKQLALYPPDTTVFLHLGQRTGSGILELIRVSTKLLDFAG